MPTDAKTIADYDGNSAAFQARTLGIDMTHLHAPFLRELPPGSHVLDLGCGVGRDARAFLAEGHTVTAVDASSEMVRIATEVTGRPALHMRFDELPFVEEFDGVWACASLLHVPKAEMPAVLARVARSLRLGGVLQLFVKYGESEGWRDGRWFSDYTVASIHATVAAVPDLAPVRYWVGQDARRADVRWVHAVARRAP